MAIFAALATDAKVNEFHCFLISSSIRNGYAHLLIAHLCEVAPMGCATPTPVGGGRQIKFQLKGQMRWKC